MAKVLQDIWILKEEGVVLFERVFKQRIDPQLFGGFMSALNMFAIELERTGLSSFEMGDKRYTIMKNSNLFFIANYHKKLSHKKAVNELKLVINRFLEAYGFDEIINWKGDITYFKDFEEKIEEFLEDSVDKFEKAIF